MKRERKTIKNILFILIVALCTMLIFSACSAREKKDTFIDAKQYIGMEYSEVESILNENKTTTFLGYNGIIKVTQEDGKVDLVAFESTEIEALKSSEILSIVNNEFGSCTYLDEDKERGNYYYYEVDSNNTYLVAQFDLNDDFVRFIFARFDKPIVSTTENQAEKVVNSEYSAIEYAKEYVKDHPQRIIEKSYIGDDIYSYKLFEVASAELEYISSDNEFYSIIVRGNFSAYNEYGNWTGSYNYETKVLVYTDGNIRINYSTLTKKY